MRPLALLGALLLAACGGSDPMPPAAAAEQPAAPAPTAAGTGLDSGLGGRWYVFMNATPWMAMRLDVLPATEGPRASWITFDWMASPDADHLSSASSPTGASVDGDPVSVIVSGPVPMLGADGQPNGHNGSWLMKLAAAADGPPRFVGVATHPDLTGPAGTAVEMTREWRTWKRQ